MAFIPSVGSLREGPPVPSLHRVPILSLVNHTMLMGTEGMSGADPTFNPCSNMNVNPSLAKETSFCGS